MPSKKYSWPGNVRELRNVIEHAMIVSKSKSLEVHVPKPSSTETNATENLHDVERMHLVAVLEKTSSRLAGPGGAAEVLGLKRTTLQAKMKKLGISIPPDNAQIRSLFHISAHNIAWPFGGRVSSFIITFEIITS